MKNIAGLLAALLVILIAAPTYAEKIGSIKTVEGDGWVLRKDKKIPAFHGQNLLVKDIIGTGNRGGIGIILIDDTLISMGPGSTMELEEFLFKPEKKQFGMITRFVKGTFTYLSGIIAKIEPEAVQIVTPDGMVAVRGTHFLVKVK